MRPDDIQKELDGLAPTLSKLTRQAGDKAPEGYFDNLPDITWNKIKDNNKVVKIGSQPKFSYSLIGGIAASLLVLLGCVYMFTQQSIEPEELLVEEMVDYMIDEVDLLDSELIFELYSTTEDVVDNDSDVYEYLKEDGLQDIDEQFLESIY